MGCAVLRTRFGYRLAAGYRRSVLKDDYPDSNIVAVDYDPGATKINQENRIKLMLANAKRAAAQGAEATQQAAVPS